MIKCKGEDCPGPIKSKVILLHTSESLLRKTAENIISRLSKNVKKELRPSLQTLIISEHLARNVLKNDSNYLESDDKSVATCLSITNEKSKNSSQNKNKGEEKLYKGTLVLDKIDFESAKRK